MMMSYWILPIATRMSQGWILYTDVKRDVQCTMQSPPKTDFILRLFGKQMGSSDLVVRGATLCEVPGKGLGLVATRGEHQKAEIYWKIVTGLILIVANFSPELTPGSLVVAEQPLLVLDPPTDRKTLLKTLGCDWCKVGWDGEKRLMQPSLGEHEGTTWGCQSSNSAVAGWPDGKEKLHYALFIGWLILPLCPCQGEEDVPGGEGAGDELCWPRWGERWPENSLGGFPHKCTAFRWKFNFVIPFLVLFLNGSSHCQTISR